MSFCIADEIKFEKNICGKNSFKTMYTNDNAALVNSEYAQFKKYVYELDVVSEIS